MWSDKTFWSLPLAGASGFEVEIISIHSTVAYFPGYQVIFAKKSGGATSNAAP